MNQLLSNQTFADTGPNSAVNAARLTAHVNQAALLNGAVIDQTERTTPNAGDYVLLGDSTQPDTGTPLKCQVQNLQLQQQRDGTQQWGGVAAGTANNLVVTCSPARTGNYNNGEVIRFVVGSAVNTGAVTINADGRGVKNLFTKQVVAMLGGELTPGACIEATFDGTQFQAGLPPALKSVSTAMLSELARGGCAQWVGYAYGTPNALTAAPTDSLGNPAYTAYRDGMQIRFLASSANTGSVTIAVNGLAAIGVVKINGTGLTGGEFQQGCAYSLTYSVAANKFFMENRLSRYVATAASTLATGLLTFAHGLGAVPMFIRLTLVNQTTQTPWTVGQEVDVTNVGNTSYNWNWWADATNVYVAITNVSALTVSNGTTSVNLTAASWKLKVYAEI